MKKERIIQEYFDWLSGVVCDNGRFRKGAWRGLLHSLHERPFIYYLEMDENRAYDGADLRCQFGYTTNYDPQDISDAIDNQPCSVLEMMIALAIRCEVHIMDDPIIGNRTGQWFWSMIESLGLSDMHGSKLDERRVDDVITRFLERNYEPNGNGGLFTVKRFRQDLRTVEIWYQMMWYLDEIISR